MGGAKEVAPPEADEGGGNGGAPVLPWRLVAGAALHFVLPAYLVTLVLAWAVGGGGREPLGLVGAVSWRFCLAYAVLSLAASLGAALADPALRRVRARGQARDPATPVRASAARVESALRKAEGIGSVPMWAAVASLRAARWDHADERCRAVGADLSRAVDAFATSHASAVPAERWRVAALAADALGRIAGAVEDLAAERARLDQGDAATHARYIAERYGHR